MTFTRPATTLFVALALIAWAADASAKAAAGDSSAHKSGTAEESVNSDGEVNTDPMELQTDLALWTAVIFLLLMAVLWKFAWGPISQGLQRREQGIADQITQADEANQQAKQLLEQYEQKLVGAKDEVREMIAQARRDAEQVGQQMIDKAKQESQAEQQRALQQIDVAISAALKELADQGATLAVELAGKIVGAQLKATDHQVLISETVSQFTRRVTGADGPAT